MDEEEGAMPTEGQTKQASVSHRGRGPSPPVRHAAGRRDSWSPGGPLPLARGLPGVARPGEQP
jgi:hypothetical protein